LTRGRSGVLRGRGSGGGSHRPAIVELFLLGYRHLKSVPGRDICRCRMLMRMMLMMMMVSTGMIMKRRAGRARRDVDLDERRARGRRVDVVGVGGHGVYDRDEVAFGGRVRRGRCGCWSRCRCWCWSGRRWCWFVKLLEVTRVWYHAGRLDELVELVVGHSAEARAAAVCDSTCGDARAVATHSHAFLQVWCESDCC
jgi:hypothetical protein